MLIKFYIPHKTQTLNHTPLCTNCDKCFQYKWKNLQYNTTPNSIFDNIPKETLFKLFDEQQKIAQQELELFEKYNYITTWAKNKTIEQYEHFFFYNNHAYIKSELKAYLTQDQLNQETYLQKPAKIQPQLTINQKLLLKETLLKENKRWVSRQAIRNITWYTYNPIPQWSITKTPTYVEWQHKVLEDQNDIVIVNWSRQIGKSWTISEKCIEESHIPNNDMLVGWFTTNTTNIIRNYVLKYIRKFPKDTFTHYKSERYIINNQTGTKIYFRTLSDDAQSILWMTLKLIIVDEAQLVDEFVFEEVLLPTLSTTGWRLIMILTPWRKKSWYAFKKIMEIKKWLIEDASLYDVDITMNPFIHPKKRAEIMARKDEPWIRRQYFCDWNDWWDSLFDIQHATEFPELLKQWFFVLWKDPARIHDRSWYTLIYVYNWKATIIQSWFVPDSHKKDWSLQAKFYKELILKYTKQDYKNWYNWMDVTWVWDWVAHIFTKDWIQLHMQLRYTAWTSESQDKNNYRCWKATLINTVLDFIQEWILEVVEPTNKLLLEELSYLEQWETRTWLFSMDTHFFDDITNSMMIAVYLIAKYNLLKRTQEEQSQQKSSGSDLIDMIEQWRTYERYNQMQNDQQQDETW